MDGRETLAHEMSSHNEGIKMHHLDTDAQAFEQQKHQRLLAQAQLEQEQREMADADDAQWQAALAKLNARQARLYQGSDR